MLKSKRPFEQCSAEVASPGSATTWTMRTSFPEYVIAILTIVGSVLFSVLTLIHIVIAVLDTSTINF
jgi:hypothetical protein